MALADTEKAKTLDSFAAYGDLPSVLVSRKKMLTEYTERHLRRRTATKTRLWRFSWHTTLCPTAKSVWRSFEDYGSVNENMWQKLKWFALGFGVLVLFSIIFWFYIMFGRKIQR